MLVLVVVVLLLIIGVAYCYNINGCMVSARVPMSGDVHLGLNGLE
jgi:hypothetical protein